jgi:pyruvyltransferase
MRRIGLYRWRNKKSQHVNFGDEITIPILERVFGIEAIPVSLEEAELLGAGSILEHYARHNRQRRAWRRWFFRNDLHIWGTGTLFSDYPIEWPQRLCFHAVRGSLTAKRVGVHTVTLGDPGILASRLVDRPKKRSGMAVVPHFADKRRVALPKDWWIVDPEQPVDDVLSQIGSADLVLSSSLHGLIVADSFGIPCVWVKYFAESPHLPGSPTHKFIDYASTRGCDFNAPITWAEAMMMSRDALEAISTAARRDIEAWQAELISAFPLDVWR